MSRSSPTLLLALLLLAPGAAPAESEVDLRSRLHRDLGQLQEDMERARGRHDRRTERRIDREIKGILAELRESRRREREEMATGSDPGNTDGAAEEPQAPAAEPAESEPAGGTLRLPYLSQIRQRRFTSPVEPLQPGNRSVDPEQWNKVGRLVAPPPPPSAEAPSPPPADPQGKSLLNQLEEESAKLRVQLEEMDRAFNALSPEEQEAIRWAHDLGRRQALQSLAGAEEAKRRAEAELAR